MTGFYSIFALLIVITAAFSYINYRFIKLPATIGVMAVSLVCSLLIVIAGNIHPNILNKPATIIRSIDFETLLMRIMLSFLLFAGAIHIDVKKLKKEMAPIMAFSTISVLLSTAIVGGLMYLVFYLFHGPIPLISCLLFGALISPTDPISVLGILRKARIPPSLEIKVTGESLFNDGVGVVVFTTILEVATLNSNTHPLAQTAWLFIREAGGGILWGLILGYAAFYLLRSIDNYQVEVLITLALVMGGYFLSFLLGVSGPLAMVVAGIIVGNTVMEKAMSHVTRDFLGKFWSLLDEILNAVLFLLIGFEVLLLNFNGKVILIGISAIVIVLLARLVSVYLPAVLLSFRRSFEKYMIPVLTWGGLRGGISIAMALSLPANMYRDEFVLITYIIVVFSILVQGLTIGRIARRLVRKAGSSKF